MKLRKGKRTINFNMFLYFMKCIKIHENIGFHCTSLWWNCYYPVKMWSSTSIGFVPFLPFQSSNYFSVNKLQIYVEKPWTQLEFLMYLKKNSFIITDKMKKKLTSFSIYRIESWLTSNICRVVFPLFTRKPIEIPATSQFNPDSDVIRIRKQISWL